MKSLTRSFAKTKVSKDIAGISVQQLKDPLKDGFLCQRSLKHNKWKRRFFVLTHAGLYYFSSQNATQCKGLIRFSNYTSVLPAHNETKKPFTFQIISNFFTWNSAYPSSTNSASADTTSSSASSLAAEQTISYLMAESDSEMNSWMQAIYSALDSAEKQRKQHFRYVPATEEKIRKYRSLVINVAEAKGLTLEEPEIEEIVVDSPELEAIRIYPQIPVEHLTHHHKAARIENSYTIIEIGHNQYRTTTAVNKQNPFWGEDFTIDLGENEEFDKVAFTVWCEDKTRKPSVAGQVTFDEQELSLHEVVNQWLPLEHASTRDFASGYISLRWTYEDPTLSIRIIEGRNLASKSKKGALYVEASYLTQVLRTQTIKKNRNPFWNEELILGQVRELKVTCYDANLSEKDAFLGDFVIPIARLTENTTRDEIFMLRPRNTKNLPGSGSSSNSTTPSNSTPTTPTDAPPVPLLNVTPAAPSLDTNVGKSSSTLKLSSNSTGAPISPVLPYSRSVGANLNEYKSPQPIRLPHSRSVDNVANISQQQHNRSSTHLHGSIRLSVRYTIEDILPSEAYKPLQEMLPKEDGLKIAIALGSVVSGATERAQVSTSLVRAYDALGESTTLLIAVTSDEILSTEDPRIIFRGNSLGSKALDAYMKLVGNHYLQNTLGPFITKVYDLEKSCEIDPTALRQGKDTSNHIKRLQHLVLDALTAIYASVDQCPSPLRIIFANLQQTVAHKFGDPKVRYSVVSGFLFLRLFCAAILSPKLFDLAPDHPDTKTERNLKLVAKVIQNIANLMEFEEKEAYMKCMNSQIQEHLPLMKSFLDNISLDTPSANTTTIDLDRESACIHSFLKSHKADIHEKYSDEPGWVQTMDAILQDLDIGYLITSLKS